MRGWSGLQSRSGCGSEEKKSLPVGNRTTVPATVVANDYQMFRFSRRKQKFIKWAIEGKYISSTCESCIEGGIEFKR